MPVSHKLLVNQSLYDNAKGNKAIGTIIMDPFEFLILTVRGGVGHFIETEKKHTQTLFQYNTWVHERNILVMPFLKVDKETGTVLAHEGRHRAAACIGAKVDRMEVAIILASKGYPEYYEEPYGDDYDHPKRFYKRYLGVQDIPKRFLGQFDSSSVRPDLNTFHGFYPKEKTLAAVTFGNKMRPVSDFKHMKGG